MVERFKLQLEFPSHRKLLLTKDIYDVLQIAYLAAVRVREQLDGECSHLLSPRSLGRIRIHGGAPPAPPPTAAPTAALAVPLGALHL